MDERLYAQMQWPEIEALIYSEHDQPQQILGQKVVEDGILICSFIPGAEKVSVKNIKKSEVYPMECVDVGGYFAVLLPGNRRFEYEYIIEYGGGTVVTRKDPYNFDPVITGEDMVRFNAGIHYDIYQLLGGHIIDLDGVHGVHFAVWAPEAVRVSVVGDFCAWDGRCYPMRRLGDSGIHELFIPELSEGILYKYEIKIKGDTIVLKSDPYGTSMEERPNTASIVCDLASYSWQDRDWMKKRAKTDTKTVPMLIYEVHLAGFRKPDEADGRAFYNYRELAPMIADYVLDMGYTHIEVMPVMEHPLDESWGYQVLGYYAPTSRYGTPEDFMYFMDYLHQHGVGVILDWVPAHFPRDISGLATFDGSCLYEHKDPRQGSHPHWGTLIFNYGRPEVRNFLIANALYWAELYHADGIRMDAVASMLYLDYGKRDGEWVANMYGSNENLEAIELLKHLNSIMKKRNPDVLIIAEESTAWPKITYPVEEDGLGFDYKWNMGWMNDFTGFMKLDPLYRKHHYGELIFSIIYAYSESFVLVLSHDEVVHGKGSMIGKMPGKGREKFDNLRAAYGFMTTHPGKKLLFMGQDYAQITEFNESKSLDWFMLEEEPHLQMQIYVRDLFKLYKENPAFYLLDEQPEGFEWINCISADESIVVFLRKTAIEDETLLVVCNFSALPYENHKIGVPFPGKFKEIFNSDALKYGGNGNINPRLKQSKKAECDGRDDSITLTVPPLGMSVMTCTHLEPAKKPERTTRKNADKKVEKAPKTTEKKTTKRKTAKK